MASGLLLCAVLAVTVAITSGQQQALEANQRVAATLAAEEMLGRLLVLPYDQLPAWDGHAEPVSTMTDMEDLPLADAFAGLGRRVQVDSTLRELPDLDVRVLGRDVSVEVFDGGGRTLTRLRQFVPAPPDS